MSPGRTGVAVLGRSRSILLVVLLLPAPAFAAEPAAPWSVAEPCPFQQVAAAEQHRRRLLAAEPGSELYLPHPYPDGERQAVEDFLFDYRRTFTGLDRRLPEPARRALHRADGLLFGLRWPFVARGEALPGPARHLLALLNGGFSHARHHRVADWTPRHCGGEPEPRFRHLVRLFRGDVELLRAALAPSGRLGQVVRYDHPAHPGQPPPLPDRPRDAVGVHLAELASGLGGPPRDFQYVAVVGDLRCPVTAPCVAFRAGSGVYLWWSHPLGHRSGLYRLLLHRPRHPPPGALARIGGPLAWDEEGHPVKAVTVGAGGLVEVERVF